MTLTSTAIGFTLSSLGLAFCGLRFVGAFRKIGDGRSGSKIGILISLYFLTTALQHAVLAFGALFFPHNPEIFYQILLVDHILLAVATAIIVYAAFYIFFPSTSPWFAVSGVCALGVLLFIATVIAQPRPLLDATGGIDWNLSPQVATLLFYLLFLNTGVPFCIFFSSFLKAKSREVKIISFVIMLVTAMGLLNTAKRFLFSSAGFGFFASRIHDTTLAIIGIICIGVFIIPPIVIGWVSRHKRWGESEQ